MTQIRFMLAVCCMLVIFTVSAGQTAADPVHILQPITVHAKRVANLRPAGSFAAIASALRFDPQMDVQSRGLPEGQSDVAVRGGLFENTGLRIGAVTIFDPQTGHYAVELPVDPDTLSTPQILTGVDNGISAVNASVATVQYRLNDIRPQNRFVAGIGTDQLRHAKLYLAATRQLADNRAAGVALSAAASAGDGTLAFGDHDFKRVTGQFSVAGADSATHLILGYHDKFFGWPGAYTGFASLPETDHTRLGLILLDHRRDLDQGWWEVTAAYRWLRDDYDFDRRTVDLGGRGSFEHETRAAVLGLSGQYNLGVIDWDFSAQASADRLVRSTDLTGGDFNSRTYFTVALVPSRVWQLASGRSLVVRGGLRADFSNRDGDALMPLAAVRLAWTSGAGKWWIELDYSRNSQVPGYTALKSLPQGLFGGNPELGREFADTVSLSGGFEADSWWLKASAFHRRDEDLVDWTFVQGAPFARQANPVDINVDGFEALLGWQSTWLDVTAGYTALHKDANYHDARVDASFYALNFARHRLTLALSYRPRDRWVVRLDNEYRIQQENVLRTGSDHAYLGSFSVTWQPFESGDSGLTLVADNVSDNGFQEFPGTPPAGRQLSLILELGW